MRAILFSLLICCITSCSKEQPVNVVTIILDDATQTQIEMGMPHFMREIRPQATFYTSGVFDIPLCSPTTANYLTGRIGRETGMTNCNPGENLPSNIAGHGVTHNGANGLQTGGVGAFDFRHTILTEMQAAGYKVGWFGKYLNGYKGNSISSSIDNQPVTVNYRDADARIWKFADQFPYQPVPPGVDTWRAEYDHSGDPGVFHYTINVANGEPVGREEQWSEADTYDPDNRKAEHIDYFKHEVAKYMNANKGQKKFLTLRLFNPHNAKLSGTLPFATACAYRQALPHASKRYKGTIDPMSISLPLSLTAFLEGVSESTEAAPEDGKLRFPCGVQDGLSHQDMYAMYYRYAMAATIEALHDYDDLVKQVIDHLKRDNEFDNTLLVLFNDNGMMNGEHGVYHKNKPWRESVSLHLVIKYPHQHEQTLIDHHISNTAITPTILDVAGVKSQMPMHSQSLRKIHARAKHEKILSEGYTRLCRKWEFEQATDGNYNYFIQYFPNRSPLEFFFDTHSDPAEQNNLIQSTQHQQTIAGFRQFLKDFPGGPLNTEEDISHYRNQCN